MHELQIIPWLVKLGQAQVLDGAHYSNTKHIGSLLVLPQQLIHGLLLPL